MDKIRELFERAFPTSKDCIFVDGGYEADLLRRNGSYIVGAK